MHNTYFAEGKCVTRPRASSNTTRLHRAKLNDAAPNLSFIHWPEKMVVETVRNSVEALQPLEGSTTDVESKIHMGPGGVVPNSSTMILKLAT